MSDHQRSNARRARNAVMRSLRWLPCVDYGFPPPPRVKKGEILKLPECLSKEWDEIIKRRPMSYMRDIPSLSETGSFSRAGSLSSLSGSVSDDEDWESKIGYEQVHPLDYYKVKVLKQFDPVPEPEVVTDKKSKGGRIRKFFTNLKCKLTKSNSSHLNHDKQDVGDVSGSLTDLVSIASTPYITTVDIGTQVNLSVLRPEDPAKYQDLVDMLAFRLARRTWEFAMKELGENSEMASTFPPRYLDQNMFSQYNNDIDDLAVTTVADELAEIEEHFWTASF